MAVRILASQSYPQAGTAGSPQLSGPPETAPGTACPNSIGAVQAAAGNGVTAASATARGEVVGSAANPTADSHSCGPTSRFTQYSLNPLNQTWEPAAHPRRVEPLFPGRHPGQKGG